MDVIYDCGYRISMYDTALVLDRQRDRMSVCFIIMELTLIHMRVQWHLQVVHKLGYRD